MNCADVKERLARLYTCRDTAAGVAVSTSCLLPSFTQLSVFVLPFGDGFLVHDAGAAFASGWEHGRDEPLIRKMIEREAKRFNLKVNGVNLAVEAKSGEWLPSAILAVSNASAMAARAVVDHVVAAAEAGLVEKIYQALRLVYPDPRILREFAVDGQSGKSHKFDFAVGDPTQKILLVDGVTPHHSSIAHKYTSFADVKNALNGCVTNFAVFERPLDDDDVSLMQQVADLVPIQAVSAGAERAFP